MDLSTLKNAPGARKNRKRVGRGPSSGTGKTAGRGHKGQKARSGYSRRAGFEGGQMPLHRRIPKRGFHHRKRYPYVNVNLDVLDSAFDAGALVTPETLVAAGLIEMTKGGVKILGRGEITKKLTVKANEVTPGARAKIEAAGGTVDIIGVPASAAPKEGQEDK
jgi:large subunit ribosomal protein L15